MKRSRFTLNNFDLIRLFAAVQVAVDHGWEHLGLFGVYSLSPRDFLRAFPGVPIFFFISGFLISRSFEKNSRLGEYFQNRVLRIYPALIVCVTLSILSVWLVGYLGQQDVGLLEIVPWFASQITFLQFYHPDFIRGYGVGALNGALWTITVELQFYILIPILYGLCGLSRRRKAATNVILIALALVFLVANRVFFHFIWQFGEELWFKLIKVSFIPWIYMFLVGVLCQRNFDLVHRFLAGRFHVLLVLYVALAYGTHAWTGIPFGNEIGPLMYVPLVAVTFAAAYSVPGVSERVLGRNDLSYGLYIYHMPILNLFLYLHWTERYEFLLLALVLTATFAAGSWWLVERPALKLKRHPLNPLAAEAVGIPHGERSIAKTSSI